MGFISYIDLIIVMVAVLATAVHFMSRKAKLYILKYAVLAVSSLVILAAKAGVTAAKPFELPLYWLRHYVAGSGKALEVPLECLIDAKEALMEAVRRDDRKAAFGNYHCLYHSTLYAGSGFYDRPTLFYLLGGFTFLLRRDGKVSGKDRYDWHPTKDYAGNDQYFTSPLGKGAFAAAAMALLNYMFGNEWFVVGGFPSGEHGISNKLWDDLHEVGAKPFWSWFKNQEVFNSDDIATLIVFDNVCDNAEVRKISGVYARQITDGRCGVARNYFVCEDGYESQVVVVRNNLEVDKFWL